MRKTMHQPHHSGQDCDKMPHQNTHFTRVALNKLNVLTENLTAKFCQLPRMFRLMNQANIKELQNSIIYTFFETQLKFLEFYP